MKITDDFKMKYVDTILSEYTELSQIINGIITLLDNIENNNIQNINEAKYWPPIIVSKILYKLIKDRFDDNIILNIKRDYDYKNFVLILKFENIYLMLRMRNEELMITRNKTKIIQKLLGIFYRLQEQDMELELPNDISIESLCSIIKKYNCYNKI